MAEEDDYSLVSGSAVQQDRKGVSWCLIVVGVLVAIAVFALLVYVFGWGWTGLIGNSINTTTTTGKSSSQIFTTQYQPGKTFWDAIQLLIGPITLVLLGTWLNHTANVIAQRYTEAKDQTDRWLASDQQKEDALQTYLDKMSELLLEKGLCESTPENEVRKIAQARTLTVLQRLDGDRKGSVIRFLCESDLITSSKDNGIVRLNRADLTLANLSRATLCNTNLSESLLIDANLLFADLRGADLKGANMHGAILIKTILTNAKLDGADLRGANVTDEQLSLAESLEGTMMPDGTKHP
jgi:hypothetical protein